MANVYKIQRPSGRFNVYTSNEANFVHIIDITPQTLTYQLKDTDTDTLYHNLVFNLDNLKQNQRFGEQTWWAIDDRYITYDSVNAGTSSLINIPSDGFISILDDTYVSKRGAIARFGVDNYDMCPIRIFVPTADGDFTTCSYAVIIPDTTDLHLNGVDLNPQPTTIDVTGGTVVEGEFYWRSLLSKVTATTQSSSTAGTSIKVNVTAEETNLKKLYLEPICGVLDRTEVKLTNGSGSFNILTSTLIAGETVEVKIGHKKFSNITKFTKVLS